MMAQKSDEVRRRRPANNRFLRYARNDMLSMAKEFFAPYGKVLYICKKCYYYVADEEN